MSRFYDWLEKESDIIKHLKACDDIYYNAETPFMTDTDYDILKARAKELYPNNDYFKTIGSPVSNGKVDLPFVLGSLNKIKPDTIDKWLDIDTLYLVSEKLDGMSALCTWINGKVVFASTRGDGMVGMNILDKVKIFMPDIPEKDPVSLRCELLLVDDDYKTLGYKDKRGGVAGIINSKTPSIKALKMIHPCFYEYIEGPKKFDYELDRIKYIKDTLGLNVPSFKLVKNTDNNLLNDLLMTYKSYANYDIDGLVITLNESERENILYPKKKIAYKVNEDAIEATVNDIEWNVTRTGRIMPVVIIDPITISGSTISRATGFNAKFIMDNNINIGAKVGIVKSGQVIPYLCEIIKKSNIKIDLNTCPSCGMVLTWRGVDLVCENTKCRKATITKIAHFFKIIGAEYITVKTVEKLGVSSIEDMYNLEELNIINIEGFGVRKAEQIINEIQKTLNIEPYKLLASFGIPSIGRRMSTSIMKSFTFDELFDSINYDRLKLGIKTREKFVKNINKYKPLYEFLLNKGLTFKTEKKEEIKMLSNKKLVLTGKAPYKRDHMIALIEKNGGTVSSSVTKTTNLLVTSDLSSTSGKTKKAKDYGIDIMTYEDLFNIIDKEI